jgi:hypothetical protein
VREKWKIRQLSDDIKKIDEQAEGGNMQPVWDLRTRPKGKYTKQEGIEDEEGGRIESKNEELERRLRYAKENPHEENGEPKMFYISNEAWETVENEAELEIALPHALAKTRKEPQLHRRTQAFPEQKTTETPTAKMQKAETQYAIAAAKQKKSPWPRLNNS